MLRKKLASITLKDVVEDTKNVLRMNEIINVFIKFMF